MEIDYNSYFECITKTGEHYDFNMKCNAVDYSENSVAIFMHIYPNIDDSQNGEVLAMIPWSNVYMIVSSKI